MALICRFLMGTGAGGGKFREPPSCHEKIGACQYVFRFWPVRPVYSKRAGQKLTEKACEGCANCCASALEIGLSCCQFWGTPCSL